MKRIDVLVVSVKSEEAAVFIERLQANLYAGGYVCGDYEFIVEVDDDRVTKFMEEVKEVPGYIQANYVGNCPSCPE